MVVDDFNQLPPERASRAATSRRSGESVIRADSATNAAGLVIGGEYLASVRFERYFVK